MKKFTKVLALVLALSMVFVFASCGEKKEEEKAFFIGATGPLTGDAASYGTSVKQGAQLAIDEINAAGGLNGFKFKFDMKDDMATAEDAKKGYTALYEDGMQVSLGSVTSGSAKAFATEAKEDKMFSLSPSASADNVIEASEYSFRVCFGDPDNGVFAAEELSKTYENIGVIYDTSSDYSKGIFDAFDAKMKELNKAITVKTFDTETNKDFSTQVEALKDCDVIFLPIYYKEAGLIAKACVDKGCDAVLYGCDGLDGVKEQIDEKVTNEITYITPFDVNSTDEKVSAFVKAYEAKYGAKPDQFAAGAYDAVYAIYEAMKKNDVKDVEIKADVLGDMLVKTFTSEDFKVSGVTGEMQWNAAGACVKPPIVVKVQ